jgi:RNA polymerase sigma-70 factor, ECF subfamily
MDLALMYDDPLVDEFTPSRAGALKEATDEGLVAKSQTGDYHAFEELVRRYRNDVYSLAYHFVRNREEAWDISQEVFIKAHRALNRFRGDASFKTWLMRITANQCKDFFKKRRLATIAFDDVVREDQVAGSDDGPRKALETRELGQAILAALDTLSEKHRTAIVLREFEGLSYEEMAGVMGTSQGTVMSRLHHARKKLQKALGRMGVLDESYGARG